MAVGMLQWGAVCRIFWGFRSPRPGLVIRYDYLQSREAAAGRDHRMERPACLIAATDTVPSPRFVVILPITRPSPDTQTIGVELPVARRSRAAALCASDGWRCGRYLRLLPTACRFPESAGKETVVDSSRLDAAGKTMAR